MRGALALEHQESRPVRQVSIARSRADRHPCTRSKQEERASPRLAHTVVATLHSTALLAVAGGDAIGPAGLEDVHQAGVVIRKLGIEITDRVLLCLCF